jgi:hypothetical protein
MCVYDLIHEKSTISLVFIVPIVLAGDKSFFLNNENKSDSVNTVWISQRERAGKNNCEFFFHYDWAKAGPDLIGIYILKISWRES